MPLLVSCFRIENDLFKLEKGAGTKRSLDTNNGSHFHSYLRRINWVCIIISLPCQQLWEVNLRSLWAQMGRQASQMEHSTQYLGRRKKKLRKHFFKKKKHIKFRLSTLHTHVLNKLLGSFCKGNVNFNLQVKPTEEIFRAEENTRWPFLLRCLYRSVSSTADTL